MIRKASPLKLCRVGAGYTQAQISQQTNIPQPRISLLERGLIPNADEVAAISQALKANPCELFPGLEEFSNAS